MWNGFLSLVSLVIRSLILVIYEASIIVLGFRLQPSDCCPPHFIIALHLWFFWQIFERILSLFASVNITQTWTYQLGIAFRAGVWCLVASNGSFRYSPSVAECVVSIGFSIKSQLLASTILIDSDDFRDRRSKRTLHGNLKMRMRPKPDLSLQDFRTISSKLKSF